MNLFSQDSFIGGLNTRIESSKLPEASYSLLINGRITRNTIKPVKKHLKLLSPTGVKQGLYAIGDLLVIFINGIAYWRIARDNSSPWKAIDGWPALSPVGRIYAEIVPVSYYQGSIEYDAIDPDISEVRITFPGLAAPIKGQLFVTDGVNQPRVINPDGTWAYTGLYVNWTPANPNYVPLGILPKVSGSKLYLIDPIDKNKIYHSVSGRFLDFVINRTYTGDKGGDAETTFKSVDYNATTAMLALNGGGLFLGTLYGSYIITPDYTETFFAEPRLIEDKLFPTGPINERSFADINGDTAFITQAGIQSFNVTKQTQTESNNFPLGAPIADLLISPQSNTAAINYDIEALFSVDTIYGKGVLVYDTTLGTFISLDLGFGEVIDFALVKTSGSQKLFFTNTDNDLFEAYGSEKYAICRVYLGDYATFDEASGRQLPGKQHKVSNIHLQFGEVKSSADVQVSLYSDRAFVKQAIRTLAATDYPEISPRPLPYASFNQCQTLSVKLDNTPFCWKSGVYLEWDSGAQLYAMSCAGETQAQDNFQKLIATREDRIIVDIFSDTKFIPSVADTVVSTLITNLIPGEWYSIAGTVHRGDKLFTNTIFRATSTTANVNGRLKACGLLKTTYDLMVKDQPNLMIGCGDHTYDNGSLLDCVQIQTLFAKDKLIWAAGNHDLDTLNGKHFFAIKPQLRYYKHTVGIVDFFILNSGYNTAGAIVEPNGNTLDSIQALWFKAELENSTARYKIIVFHHPPFTDDISYSPGYTNLRWPFSAWGADMVISGHAHNYQRFVVDNIPYIVVSSASNDIRPFNPLENNSVIRYSRSGYLRLTIDNFNVLGEFIDTENQATLDAFGIHS